MSPLQTTRRETTILRVADSYNVVGRRGRVLGTTVPPPGNITKLSTQNSSLAELRFQRRMKAVKNRVVVLFRLLYGDCISRRLHAERAEDLWLHLSSAPCLAPEELCECLFTEVRQDHRWLRTLLKPYYFLYGSELNQCVRLIFGSAQWRNAGMRACRRIGHEWRQNGGHADYAVSRNRALTSAQHAIYDLSKHF